MLFIALAAGVVGTIGIYGMYQMNATSNMVYEQDVIPLNHLSEMRFAAQVKRLCRGIVRLGRKLKRFS